MSAFAVLTDSVLLRQIVSSVRGVPRLLLDLENSLDKDVWSALHGDTALVTRYAVQRSDRRVLEMLVDVHCSMAEADLPEKLRFADALLWAVRIAQLPALEWLHKHCPQLRASAHHLNTAIKTGRVDILDFLEVNYRHDWRSREASSCALVFAPRTQWHEVAAWLHEHDYRSCFSDYVLERVVESGDVAMLAFLHTHRPASFSGHMMYLAATSGNLDAVRILRSDPRSTRAMNVAAQHGHLAIVQFLHEVRHESCTTFAMDRAACNGFLDVVEFLHTHRTEGCTKDALNGAARYGHLAIVQFLVEHRHECCLDDALARAVQQNQHEVEQYLRDALAAAAT